jgi:Uma2 family endonuclease
MSAVKPIELISVDEYLANEKLANQKHEYAAGRVYAMAGSGNAHNRIAMSFYLAAGVRLRGKPCEAWNSDTKVRIRTTPRPRVYYPDAMIVCEPNSPEDDVQDRPVVIAEVLSKSTRRFDESEKLDAYLTIPTLSTYLMIEPIIPRVTAYEREGGTFILRRYEGLDAEVPLPAVGITIPLAELYERIDFTAVAAEEQAEDDADVV